MSGALSLFLVVLAGCGGSSTEAGSNAPADTTVCAADATPLPTPLASGFPSSFPFPSGTVVYHVEDRGSAGIIATGIATASFQDVLDALNGPAQDAGFKIDHGETEANDAEAEWAGNGYEGRWAIRTSATCAGETVIQIVARTKG